ncbi:MAG: pyrroline-5-carboxylate reductase [Candidatus Omnitrophica bacterium]|nr:pyrroline-5-carboxylate reductase [Candidatus Omnitrophota bacterium]
MFKFLRKKIGIIGYGNMGQAIAAGIKSKYRVFVFDKEKTKIQAVSGIEAAVDIAYLIGQCQVIILAVKPQDFETALEQLKGSLKDRLIISIAAGIPTGYIENIIKEARVIRAMPNIAVKIAQGESGLAKGAYATNGDLAFVRELFGLLGKVWEVSEEKIDGITAISGSGPAYIFYDMEINGLNPLNISSEIKNGYIRRLAEAAVAVGFNEKMGADLAVSTAVSSIALAAQTAQAPAVLRKMVTSPGGTTEAAIKTIIDGGSWAQAAIAAKKRAQELSRKG